MKMFLNDQSDCIVLQNIQHIVNRGELDEGSLNKVFRNEHLFYIILNLFLINLNHIHYFASNEFTEKISV